MLYVVRNMKVSIIIPFKEETDYLHECITNCLNLDYDDFELILLPDKAIKSEFNHVKIVPTGPVGPAKKRDIGAECAEGEVLAFIDDDAYPKKDWLKNIVRNFKGKTVCVGGPAVTPESDSILKKASGLVLSSKTGGGTETYRYVPGKKRYVDDFPSVNMSVKKDVFFELGGFDTGYWPGEDTKFCLDLVNKGYKIIYDPKVVVYHHRRELFLPHLKQVTSYALHRGYFVKKFPKTSFRLGYFMPSLFVVFLIMGMFASIFVSSFAGYYAAVLSFYLAMLIISGARTGNIRLLILVVPGIIATHISYGIYFVKGLLTMRLYK